MQTLKSEMCSEQSGLTAQLSDIAQRAQQLDMDGTEGSRAGSGASRAGPSRGGAGAAIRERPAARAPQGKATTPGRRVEFTPDTTDPIPMRQRGGLTRSRPAPSEPSWTPYLIGFCLLCIGPLRPLLYELVKAVPALLGDALGGAWGGGSREQDLPWYEQ